MNDWARLRCAAWIALATHAVAGVAMALVLREGLATNPDMPARMRFVVEHRVAWTAAWLSWSGAAFSIVYFFGCFSKTHRAEAVRFAVVLAMTGIVMDLAGDAVMIGAYPDAAARALRGVETGRMSFVLLHRSVVVMSGCLANGLYSLATLWAAWRTRREYPGMTRWAGFCVGVAGIVLSAAAVRDSVPGMVWSNAVLVPSIVLWQLGVAITAGKRAGLLQ